MQAGSYVLSAMHVGAMQYITVFYTYCYLQLPVVGFPRTSRWRPLFPLLFLFCSVRFLAHIEELTSNVWWSLRQLTMEIP